MDIVCDVDDCREGGGGGRGSSMACVGLGSCCATITSSAGLGPWSTSESLLCKWNSDIFYHIQFDTTVLWCNFQLFKT